MPLRSPRSASAGPACDSAAHLPNYTALPTILRSSARAYLFRHGSKPYLIITQRLQTFHHRLLDLRFRQRTARIRPYPFDLRTDCESLPCGIDFAKQLLGPAGVDGGIPSRRVDSFEFVFAQEVEERLQFDRRGEVDAEEAGAEGESWGRHFWEEGDKGRV